MKKILFIIAFLIVSPLYAIDCMDNAFTNKEIYDCSKSRLSESEKKLSQLYDELIKNNSKNVVFIKKLNSSKKAWENYRDKQIELAWPNDWYGSSYPMCALLYKRDMTESRIAELNQLLLDKVEGDVCSAQ